MRNQTDKSPAVPDGLDMDLIGKVVSDFYRSVRHDDLLGPVFDCHVTDWPAHERRIADFWSTIMLGSGAYKGALMAVHLALPGLDARHLDRWLHLFRQVLLARCTPQQAAAFQWRAEKIARAMALVLAVDPGGAASAASGNPRRTHFAAHPD